MLCGPKSHANITVKPHLSKQKPQNADALQVYFLFMKSHEVSRSLIYMLIMGEGMLKEFQIKLCSSLIHMLFRFILKLSPTVVAVMHD